MLKRITSVHCIHYIIKNKKTAYFLQKNIAKSHALRYNKVNKIYHREATMNIGEKIKNLRMSKMITQQELAGDFITRNMLSRIEHGAALPSLPTVIYLAGRLNVPAGFLLAEEENEFLYQKIRYMPNIRRAYQMGDYRICRELCETVLTESDDEIALLMAECALGLAKEEFFAGNLHNACHWFDTALRDADKTAYHTGHIAAPAIVYFRYMRGISPTLCSYEADDLLPGERDFAAWQDIFCRYVLTLEHTEQLHALRAFDDRSAQERQLAWHVQATVLQRSGEYAAAYEMLRRILAEEIAPVPVLLYSVLQDMENCCKELDDYKGAYEHALHKLSVHERLLVESTI
jgi:transcriptional regulator with XRE-family HTH domain